MNLALSLPTAVQSTGKYDRKHIATSPRSEGSYRPSIADFIVSFYAVLRRWQSETAFDSDPDAITSHPSFRAMVENAHLVTPLIIDELKTAPSILVWVLDDAYSFRPYKDEDTGDITAMSNAWIAWAERNGLTL
jgi:hypothetical protein